MNPPTQIHAFVRLTLAGADMAGFSSTRSLAFLALASIAISTPGALRAKSASRGGEMGPVSTGSIRISLSVAPRGGAEPALAEGGGVEGQGADRPLCIWSNAPVGTFSVTASDASPEWRAGDRGLSLNAYELEWTDGAGVSRMVPAGIGTGLSGLAAQSRESCEAQTRAGGLAVRRAAAAADESAARTRALLLLIAPD